MKCVMTVLGLSAIAVAAQAAVVSGVVWSGTERIPGVTVTVKDATLHKEVISSNSGSYEVTNVPPGPYTIIADIEGLYTFEHRVCVSEPRSAVDLQLDVGPSSCCLVWSLPAPKEVAWRGVVLDEVGHPLPAAQIEVPIANETRRSTTDAKGTFQITLPEEYRSILLSTSLRGYSTSQSHAHCFNDVVIRLYRECTPPEF